jgi:hypothetical protein
MEIFYRRENNIYDKWLTLNAWVNWFISKFDW